MPVDWYQVADMAVRGVGGVLFITFAYLLFRALKKCASEMFGAVRGHATGNGTGSGDPNETTTTKAADHTAYQGRAVKAAQQIVAEACDRSIVRPEHAQFYDFVLAAARAVLDYPAVAESIGKKMPPDAWQKPPKAASSQPGSSGRPEVAWLDVGSALLRVATALLLVTTVVTVVLGFGAWVATP